MSYSFRANWARSLRRIPGLALIAGLAVAGMSMKPAAARDDVPDCVRVWSEARYRNDGYDHIVHISNGCPATAICDVSTNVNPAPTRVVVPPEQHVEVLTFRGSSARDFSVHAECGLVLHSPRATSADSR